MAPPPSHRGRSLEAARRGLLLSQVRQDVGADTLDGGMRLQILDNLIAVLDGVYAHLVAKRAAYAGDPVQALKLLRQRASDLSDAEFHRAVSGIVTGLRDAHARYVGPVGLRGQVAVLPFLAEQYGPDTAPRYLVSKVNGEMLDAAEAGAFGVGVDLQTWNGMPFLRAVEKHADGETGGRPDARRARAVESLTHRSLDHGPAPDEDWVIIGYRTPDGSAAEIRLDWRVLEPGKADTAVEPGSRGAQLQAIDPAAEAVRRAKKLMFRPRLWDTENTPPVTGGRAPRRPAGVGEWLDTPLQDVVAARALTPTLGYLRIWSFDAADDDAFVAELIRLLGLLPQQGLVVDLRANPGGFIWAAERALQLFTDRDIEPTRFSLIATPVTREMADSPFNRLELEGWSPSLQASVSTGEQYAQPLALTDRSWCNDQGRHYPGPAVAVVDANTYSSGDLFAAGWVDHGIGPLVCVGQATGAGGANVWTFAQLRDALGSTGHELPPMPGGTGLTVAFRRAIRSAAGDGIPIEDLGVAGIPYAMTREDLMSDNTDLLA